jgi:F0F1-type ATP synthase membrane subunit b/b'
MVTLPIITEQAFAASTDHAATGSHGSVWDIRHYWINFIVYLGVLFFAFRGAVTNGWAARRSNIQQAVNSAAKELHDADAELRLLDKLVANIEFDRQRARDEIIRQGEVEALKILEDARDKAARIRDSAQGMITAEARTAEQSFRVSLVTRAMEIARERFRSGEFSGKQRAYVDAALSRAKRMVQ